MPNYLLHKDSGEVEIVTGNEPFSVRPAAGDGTYDVYRLDNAASVTVTTADTTAPILTNLTVTVSEQNQAVLEWFSDEASGLAYWVCTTSLTTPDAAQVKAGQDHNGDAAEASGTKVVDGVGSQNTQPIDGLQAGATYTFHLLQEDSASNTSNTLTTQVTLPSVDDVPPQLSDVSATIEGQTATLAWRSNEGNGAAFWVCTNAATTPTVAQIIAGQDHTGSAAVARGMQVVGQSGAQDSQTVSGLTVGPEYFFHLIHQDDNGNTSAVVSTTGIRVAGSSGVTAQINILSRSVTQVAPEGFAFDISVDGFDTSGPAAGEVYDPRLHDLYYYWDFGDSYAFQAPEKLVPENRTSHKAYGPKVAHVYRRPGTYDVSCLVIEPESGKRAVASLRINVGDPEALFAGANTLYVDGQSNWTSAPAGARVFRDFGEAVRAAHSAGELQPQRIMLARGQTFDASGLPSIGRNTAAPSFCIVASEGSGAKPVVNLTNSGFFWEYKAGQGAPKDFWAQNIDFVGSWNATTQSGGRRDAFFLRENPPVQFLLDQCSFSGFNLALHVFPVDSPLAPSNPYVFVNDTHITNWRSAAVFGRDFNCVLLGNKLAQHTDALSGYRDSGNNLISAVRLVTVDTAIIAQNDFFSRTGWFQNTPGIYTTQPCLRMNTRVNEGSFFSVTGNAMEGGFALVELQNSEGQDGRAVNAIFEKNVLIGSHDTSRIFGIGYGGTTIRNNLGIIPNAPTYSVPKTHFVTYSGRGTNAANRNAPQKVYNNSFISLVSPANAANAANHVMGTTGDPSIFARVHVDNNINHQPAQGVTGDGPFDAPVLWPPRYTHYQDDDTARDSSKGTPDDTVALYRPTGSSAALGDAINGEVAYDDFFGNMRPQYPSRGAFEAS